MMKYGYSKLTDTDCLMNNYISTGKKQIVFWAECVRSIAEPHVRYMTYDTFKTRLREYLRRTKQKLSGSQVDRVRLSNQEVERFVQLYLLSVSSTPMTMPAFFEKYMIVPPYDAVPSYELFRVKVVQYLHRESCRALIALKHHEDNNMFSEQQATVEAASGSTETTGNLELDIGSLSLEADVDLQLDNYQHEDNNAVLGQQRTAEQAAVVIMESMDVKNQVEHNKLCPTVKKVYRCITQATGSLGGNGSGGPIYGELTVGSMQNIVDYLVEFCAFDPSSRFIDIGAGLGKPNWHVAQNPGVRLSIGIEVEKIRWKVSAFLYTSLACLYFKYRICI